MIISLEKRTNYYNQIDGNEKSFWNEERETESEREKRMNFSKTNFSISYKFLSVFTLA